MWRNNELVQALSLLDLSPRRVVVAIAAGVAALGSALALAAVAAWLIARAWTMPPVLDLSIAVVCVRALGISRGVFRYLERLAAHDTALRGTTAARASIYHRLADRDAEAVTPLRRGDLLTRTGEDVDIIGGVVVRAVIPIAVAAVLAVAAVALSAFVSVPAALVLAAALIGAGVLAPWWSARRIAAAERDCARARARFAERAMVAIDHAAELRVAGRLTDVLDGAGAARERSIVAADRASAGAAVSAAAVPLATGVSVFAALLFAIAAAPDRSPMALAVLVLLPLAAFEAAAGMPEAARELVKANAAAARIMDLLNHAAPERVRPDLSDLDLHPGARIAVVGPSGSGKTTLLMALAKRHDDAVFFAEDAHIFDTSILENLRVARGDIDVSEALEALDAVGLGDCIHSLPDGLDTTLIGGARAVSGGQRRRILLARALLSSARVLLLDEPTEHLDAAEGADLLHRLLDRSAGLVDPDRTVVVVTHQLPSDTNADQVLQLSDKCVAEPPNWSYVRQYTRKEVV